MFMYVYVCKMPSYFRWLERFAEFRIILQAIKSFFRQQAAGRKHIPAAFTNSLIRHYTLKSLHLGHGDSTHIT